MTHFEPKDGTGLRIAHEIDNVLIEYNSESSLLALGMDGCPVNCAPHKGVARKVELPLGRPLQWLVCLLHTHELILRHLFEELDGKANGPLNYTGPIGQKMCKLKDNLEPFVKFDKIKGLVPKLERESELLQNNDQKYLYSIALGVQEGHLDPDFWQTPPGTVNLARWYVAHVHCPA